MMEVEGRMTKHERKQLKTRRTRTPIAVRRKNGRLNRKITGDTANMALRRIQRELSDYNRQANVCWNDAVRVVSDPDNLFLWTAVITGPEVGLHYH